jgi:hypothetical protein
VVPSGNRSPRGRLAIRMNAKVLGASTALGLLLSGASALGHHSFAAEFDADRPVRLNGTITKIEWTNPHASIYLDVKGPDGKVVNWAIETTAPNAMSRMGFHRDALPAGTVLSVYGYLAKLGPPKAKGLTVTLSNGRSWLCRPRRRARSTMESQSRKRSSPK